MFIDLRSDTVTRPTPAMLAAMMKAPVGDDVFGEDPSVKPARDHGCQTIWNGSRALLPERHHVQSNSYKVSYPAGDEVICEKNSHVYIYEGGGIAFNSGVPGQGVGWRPGAV